MKRFLENIYVSKYSTILGILIFIFLIVIDIKFDIPEMVYTSVIPFVFGDLFKERKDKDNI